MNESLTTLLLVIIDYKYCSFPSVYSSDAHNLVSPAFHQDWALLAGQ